MKKSIDLKDLIRDKKGNIDWIKNIGKELNFKYEDIEDKIKIVDYKKNSNRVFIQYKEFVRGYNPSKIIYCNFNNILGKYNEYIYNEGEVVKGFFIIKPIWIKHQKGYLCQCLDCNKEVELLQSRIQKSNNIRCPKCKED